MITKGIAIILICTIIIIGEVKDLYGVREPEPQFMTFEEFIEKHPKEVIKTYDMPHIDAEKFMNVYSDHFWEPEKQEEIMSIITGKYIKITGKITNIKHYFGESCVSFHTQRDEKISDGWAFFMCGFYDSTEIEKLKKYKSGDEITIIGKCGNNTLTAWSLEHCFIVD